mmetsp:Transcript_81492/g.141534  ORF Transcript_81492/g.141534 Transcript_81492/m.141534 type:complete len:239 (-) Transcript_81492:121-837(-)
MSLTFEMQVLKQGSHPKKTVELMEGATVGDIIQAIALAKEVPASEIFITKEQWNDKVKLHKIEVPDRDIQIGGVQDLQGVPSVLVVSPKEVRTSLTKEEAMGLQDELIAEYSDPVFFATVQAYQKLFMDGIKTLKEYPKGLEDVLRPVKKKVWPKWGYEVSTRGMMIMDSHFTDLQEKIYAESNQWDLEIQGRVAVVQGLVGLDFAWVPSSMYDQLPEWAKQGVKPGTVLENNTGDGE